MLCPLESKVSERWEGEAKLIRAEYDWGKNMIDARMILELSSRPSLGVGNATRGRGRVILVNSEPRAMP